MNLICSLPIGLTVFSPFCVIIEPPNGGEKHGITALPDGFREHFIWKAKCREVLCFPYRGDRMARNIKLSHNN